MEFDHAGIATDDFDGVAGRYRGLFDAVLAHEEEFDGLRVGFLDLGESYLELLEPLPDADGAVPRYLADHGPGVHHLAFRTADVGAALTAAREAGVEPVDGQPRPGAWGHDVAFLHPGSTGGVLVEFVEH